MGFSFKRECSIKGDDYESSIETNAFAMKHSHQDNENVIISLCKSEKLVARYEAT